MEEENDGAASGVSVVEGIAVEADEDVDPDAGPGWDDETYDDANCDCD